MKQFNMSFYKGKKVFVTGHTGFKGSWLCKMLTNVGAEVTGYSLNSQPVLLCLKLLALNRIFTLLSVISVILSL